MGNVALMVEEAIDNVALMVDMAMHKVVLMVDGMYAKKMLTAEAKPHAMPTLMDIRICSRVGR